MVAVLAWNWFRDEQPLPDGPALAAQDTTEPQRQPDARDLPRIETFERFDPSTLPTASDVGCPISIAMPREVPPGEVVAPYLGRGIGTGELYGTEHFDATIRHYAMRYAPDVEVRPASRGKSTRHGAGVDERQSLHHAGHVIPAVTDWRDPIVVEGGIDGARKHRRPPLRLELRARN
jgi:hypothetical protein